MSVEDFETDFSEKELKEVPLKTYKGKGDGTIFLRALPDCVVTRFKSLMKKIARKEAVNMLSGEDFSAGMDFKINDDDLLRAEYYLIRAAVADFQGKLILEDDKVFDKWIKNVKPDLVNEVICHIENLNELYGGFDGQEAVIESYKKK